MAATHHRRPARPRRRDESSAAVAAPPIEGADGAAQPLVPEGHRDADGFWFPQGYASPSELFTPQQRRAQARQRALRRHGAALTPPGPSV
jgi:hypothetical protein